MPITGGVLLDDHDVTADPMYVRARKGIGYLPQEPSIFRGLTVEQNLLAILETLPIDAAERRTRLTELLSELNLTPLARAKAYTLSGGERRRVEITRALVNRPKFMLLDEPFAGHRSHRRRRNPENHRAPQGTRDWRARDRPQCA